MHLSANRVWPPINLSEIYFFGIVFVVIFLFCLVCVSLCYHYRLHNSICAQTQHTAAADALSERTFFSPARVLFSLRCSVLNMYFYFILSVRAFKPGCQLKLKKHKKHIGCTFEKSQQLPSVYSNE